MADSPADSSRRRTLLRLLITFVVAFDVAFVWQKIGGAYESEFGAHPDEAAHYVTGLFVRDSFGAAWTYARHGFQGDPVKVAREFAREFYAHYPKVALGVWPPAFYVTQAAWTLPFGTSRLSVLLLMAALAGVTAVLIFECARRSFGTWAAAGAALLWLCAPFVQENYRVVMAETLSALTMLGATMVWGRYLERDRKWDAVVFALLASAAILTKGTGLALVLMGLFSLLLLRTWHVLARPSFWAAVMIIVALAGTWTWTFRNEGTRVGGWEHSGFTWEFTRTAAPYYALKLAQSLGYGIALFAVLGIFAAKTKDGSWAALTSLVLAVLVFQSLVPVGHEARHLLPATTGWMILAVCGAFAVARHPRIVSADTKQQIYRERLWILLLALLMLPQAIKRFERKFHQGFERLAVSFLEAAPDGSRVLVCSDASGEGMFISEVAMRDRRPNLFIERASKTLVDPEGRTWGGRFLRLRFLEDAALLDYILRSEIDFIALDTAIPEDRRTAYHDQLKRVIAENTGVFWPIAESPVYRDNEPLFPPLRLIRVVRDQLGTPRTP